MPDPAPDDGPFPRGDSLISPELVHTGCQTMSSTGIGMELSASRPDLGWAGVGLPWGTPTPHLHLCGELNGDTGPWASGQAVQTLGRLYLAT